MQFLTFVLEASLLAPLVEFATSSSGHVEPRRGLAFGWLGSAVAGLAAVFSTADQAQAGDCHGIAVGSMGWRESNIVCDWLSDHSPVYYTYQYHHNPEPHKCVIQQSQCG